jgi:hypothetical protein
MASTDQLVALFTKYMTADAALNLLLFVLETIEATQEFKGLFV